MKESTDQKSQFRVIFQYLPAEYYSYNIISYNITLIIVLCLYGSRNAFI